MTIARFRLAALVGILSFVSAASASASAIGTTFGNGNATLFDIDLTTGATSNLRNTGLTFVDGIAFRTVNQGLYALTNAGDFFQLNILTGAATLIGSTGFVFIEADLAYDASADVFYGIQENTPGSGAERLIRIDPTTGAGTLVGALNPAGSPDYSAGAFDLAGTFWVLNTSSSGVNSTLLSINKNTAATLTTVPLNADIGSAAGLSFDPATGAAYIVDSTTNNRLRLLNTTTGAVSDIGDLGLSGSLVSGLAFVPNPVPEPATLTLLGAGILVARSRFTRRKS